MLSNTMTVEKFDGRRNIFMRNNNELVVSPTPCPQWEPIEIDWESSYYGIRHSSGHEWCFHIEDDFELAAKFLYDQFKRFNIATPSTEDVRYIWDNAIALINTDDSYFFYHPASDIKIWDDPSFYQFVTRDESGYVYETDCSQSELFVQTTPDIGAWTYLYNTPGLSQIDDNLNEFAQEYFYSCDYDIDERGFFIKYYEDVGINPYDAFHMGVWAIILWTLTPEARRWKSYNEVIDCCYNYGSALLSASTIYPPHLFKKLSRPAHSCVVCFGRQSCVTTIDINLPPNKINILQKNRRAHVPNMTPGTYYICEHCRCKLVYPTPHCLWTGCLNIGCRYHISQLNNSSKLLV
jgi:hypothetical protein